MEKKVVVLFSGGKDSFLATCNLIEQGYQIYMITFENGAGLCALNAQHGAEGIIKRYGKDKAEFLGIQCVAGIWREFLLPFLNLKPSEILSEFGEITYSQFNCLTCRSAMYVWTVMKAREMGVRYVADGARKDQGFVIELPCMIERFKELFAEFGIELLLPVWDLNSGWREKNLLIRHGFVPKTLEPQCLIGAPLPGDKAPDEKVQQAVVKYFNTVVLPRALEIIAQNAISLEPRGELI